MQTAVPLDQDRVARLLAADPEALRDPFPVWRMLREAGPVLQVGPTFFVTRHRQFKAVLRDPARFSSDSNRKGSRADHLRAQLNPEQLEVFNKMWDFQALFMVATDGETHERLRRIAHRAFTPRRIAELQEAATRYVDAFTAELEENGGGDLMQLAYRVPLMIIGDLMGTPESDREQVKDWSHTWGANRGATDDRLFVAWDAMQQFRSYVDDLIEQYQREPGRTDLVADLIGAQHEERLNAEELAAMFFVLLFAGHETTTNLIATGMLELLRHPEQWRLLCSDPDEVAPGATEELLRYVCPVQWAHRLALEDTDVAGTVIPEGSTVFAVIGSANRDPEVFDDPDRLDLTRANAGQHVGLGFGEHFCLGASLARLEATTAYRTLATRLPNLELAVPPEELEWGGHAQLRGLKALPVRLA